MLPDFIIIGAMKCGTTSLHHYLSLHPDISVSRRKELDFFVAEENWARGLAWYESQFPDKGKVRGEASPKYTFNPRWTLFTASCRSGPLSTARSIPGNATCQNTSAGKRASAGRWRIARRSPGWRA